MHSSIQNLSSNIIYFREQKLVFIKYFLFINLDKVCVGKGSPQKLPLLESFLPNVSKIVSTSREAVSQEKSKVKTLLGGARALTN